MSDSISALETAVHEKLAAASAALHAPGPKSLAKARQRVAMNAITHGLTGQNVFLTDDEFPAYLQLGADYIEELRPVGTREVQLAQKIIDANWRLNRIAAIENNLLNSSLLNNIVPGRTTDDRLEAMVAQSDGFRSDCDGPNAFDKLGRYESRLTRTLLKMTEELERLQTRRIGKDEDTFVLAESQAWKWYRDTLRAFKALNAAKSITSGPDPFCKKDLVASSSKRRELPKTFSAG